MITIISIVTPNCDWGVFYALDPTHALISKQDYKLWEGHEYMSNGFQAIVEALGGRIEYWEFLDEDEVDGCTPDRFQDIKHKRKMH